MIKRYVLFVLICVGIVPCNVKPAGVSVNYGALPTLVTESIDVISDGMLLKALKSKDKKTILKWAYVNLGTNALAAVGKLVPLIIYGVAYKKLLTQNSCDNLFYRKLFELLIACGIGALVNVDDIVRYTLRVIQHVDEIAENNKNGSNDAIDSASVWKVFVMDKVWNSIEYGLRGFPISVLPKRLIQKVNKAKEERRPKGHSKGEWDVTVATDDEGQNDLLAGVYDDLDSREQLLAGIQYCFCSTDACNLCTLVLGLGKLYFWLKYRKQKREYVDRLIAGA